MLVLLRKIILWDRTRSNGFKLKKGNFRLGIRKKFLTTKAMKHWKKLLKELVDSLSLEVFRSKLDKPLD